jgi:hypothetical protein
MLRLAFDPVEGGRFIAYREHVEYFPGPSQYQLGEHVWARVRIGIVDDKRKAKMERRMDL